MLVLPPRLILVLFDPCDSETFWISGDRMGPSVLNGTSVVVVMVIEAWKTNQTNSPGRPAGADVISALFLTVLLCLHLHVPVVNKVTQPWAHERNIL